MQIELLKPHTHAGIHYAPGAIVAMDEAPAQWLIDTEVAIPAASSKTHPPIPKTEEKSK